jgi:hypothetical protein
MITDKNFGEYFFKADGNYKPEKGQVLARFQAAADFVDGWMKRNIIQMLCENKRGADTSLRVMRKLVNATEKDAVKVLLEMANDLKNGLSVDEVADKPYRFVMEQFYWTKKEYVPDDLHWDIIECVDLRGKGEKLSELKTELNKIQESVMVNSR